MQRRWPSCNTPLCLLPSLLPPRAVQEAGRTVLQSASEQDDSFSHPLANHSCPAKEAHLEKRWRCVCPSVRSHLVPPVCSTTLTAASFSTALGWKSCELRSPGGSTVVQVGAAAGMPGSKPTLAPASCGTTRHATRVGEQKDFSPRSSWGIIPAHGCPQSPPALAVQQRLPSRPQAVRLRRG